MDLGNIHMVTRLQTEGVYHGSVYQNWVKQIKVKIGMDEGVLIFIEDDQGKPKVKKGVIILKHCMVRDFFLHTVPH